MPKIFLKYKKLTETAKAPVKAHPSDAGFDVFADESVIITPRETVGVNLGIAIQLNKGFFADVRPRSGMSLNTGLKCMYGTVDNGYRGPIKAIFFNSGDQIESINHGDKIAQLVIQHLPNCEPMEVDELSPSDRGENGFGSTGGK